MQRTKKAIEESHEILGVTRSTPKEEMKSKFKRLIMAHHPDHKEEADKERYEEASKIYIHAYKVVTDEEFMAKVEAYETGKIGKNQDCYCESEKKYKHCCGKT
jgi:DnaJ-class molecular chaperone